MALGLESVILSRLGNRKLVGSREGAGIGKSARGAAHFCEVEINQVL